MQRHSPVKGHRMAESTLPRMRGLSLTSSGAGQEIPAPVLSSMSAHTVEAPAPWILVQTTARGDEARKQEGGYFLFCLEKCRVWSTQCSPEKQNW